MARDRRQQLLEPFADEYARSVARQAAPPPKGIVGLVAWLVNEFQAEVPEELHKSGIWRDYTRADEERQAEGGSLLGAPALRDDFRQFIEGSPLATEASEYEGHQSRDGDEHYVTPLRAALARLAGHGSDTDPYPFMARTLYRTAVRGGDWEGACASMGIPAPVRPVYIESALVRLWRRYTAQPPARVLRD